jgi:hypothetical protein
MKIFAGILILCLLSGPTKAQEKSPLTDHEKNAILLLREEEKMARDVYDSLFTLWGSMPFGHIRESEQSHMDRMKSLLDQYRLKDPISPGKDIPGVFTDRNLKKLYDSLVLTGSRSETDAFNTGAWLEEYNILDLEKSLSVSRDSLMKQAYSDLIRASEHHLNAFVRNLKRYDKPYTPSILSQERFDKIIHSGHGPQRGRQGSN